MAVWVSTSDTRVSVRAPARVHKETASVAVKETSQDLRAWQLSEDAALAAFRFLRAHGETKGLSAECMQDAKSDGAIAVYELTRRYLRRYGASAVDLDYKRLIRRAKRGVERYLRREVREAHESLDAPAHLTLESPALSLEASTLLHESLEAALGLALAWPLSDDALAWYDAKVSAEKRRSSKIGRGRVERVSVA